MSQIHPLSSADEWYFSQHSVQVHAPIYVVPQKRSSGRRGGKKVLNGRDDCREGVLSQLRHVVAGAIGSRRQDPLRSWSKIWEQHSEVDLDRPMLRQPGESFIAVAKAHITYARMQENPHYKPAGKRTRHDPWTYGYKNEKDKMIRNHGFIELTNDMVREYIDVCNAVVGPIGVLMSPDRYQGDWWTTNLQECTRSRNDGMLRWYGVDNTCVAHPALASLYSGLVRQCAFIVRAGKAELVRNAIADLPLKECLTQSDPELALQIIKKMRHWIAVPALKRGSAANIPVSVGTLPKVIALHKAIYAHGFEKTFGTDFVKGWAAGGVHNHGYGGAATGRRFNGIHTFMGRRGENARGKRIKELAKTTV